jgi:N-acetylglucosamine-6-phosphate deacetylase
MIAVLRMFASGCPCCSSPLLFGLLMTENTIVTAKLFTGHTWLQDVAISVKDGTIQAINPASGSRRDAAVVAPAFVDLQIYGANSRLLSVYPVAETVEAIAEYSRRGGATHFQATVETQTEEVVRACVDAVREYWRRGGKGCWGLHVEGPWINKQKKGVHGEHIIHSPTLEEARRWMEYGKGVITMVTLAPEVCLPEVIDLIQSYGVVVSAGHSDATYDEATAAFNRGVRAATHLYNAMRNFSHRGTSGIVEAIFDHPGVVTSVIPDGLHVSYPALRTACKVLKGRIFAITDAVTETSQLPYPHKLVGDHYEANGTFSGSALTMALAVRNLVRHAGIDEGEALQMASLLPHRVMGREGGTLYPGAPADLVVLDEEWNVVTTFLG